MVETNPIPWSLKKRRRPVCDLPIAIRPVLLWSVEVRRARHLAVRVFRVQSRKWRKNYFLAFLVVLPAAFLGEAFFAGAFVAFLAAITIYS